MSKSRPSFSIADFEVAHVIYLCRKSRSSLPLIEHLRADKPVNADLKVFMADILSGKERLKSRAVRELDRYDRHSLTRIRDGWASALMGRPNEFGRLWEGDEGWSRLLQMGREAGFAEPEESLQNRQIARRCAEMIIAHDLRCTMDQLDVVLRPRARGRQVAYPFPGTVSGKK